MGVHVEGGGARGSVGGWGWGLSAGRQQCKRIREIKSPKVVCVMSYRIHDVVELLKEKTLNVLLQWPRLRWLISVYSELGGRC